MKKILSLALALMMLVSVFALTSCEKEPKELLDDAAKALAEKPYTMTMKMDFQTENAQIQEVFDMMNMEIPITVDGDNVAMDMSMDMMGQSIALKMTIVDKVLYYSMSAGGMGAKMKATLNDEQFAEFKGENGAEMPVDYSHFGELTAEKKDGKTVITCTGITDEGKKALNDQMASSLGEGGTATVGDLSYTITLKDGKFESMNLSCTYTVSVSGISISATMNMSATYEYKDVAAITAPADAADYQEMPYDQIQGGGI